MKEVKDDDFRQQKAPPKQLLKEVQNEEFSFLLQVLHSK